MIDKFNALLRKDFKGSRAVLFSLICNTILFVVTAFMFFFDEYNSHLIAALLLVGTALSLLTFALDYFLRNETDEGERGKIRNLWALLLLLTSVALLAAVIFS